MIYNQNKIYASVWKATRGESGKYIDLQITTSEKDVNGDFVNSTWFPRCIGKAVNTLKDVKRGDRILITKSKFTNESRRQEDGSYRAFFSFIILEAEPLTKNNTQTESSQKPIAIEDIEECPW